MARHRRQDHGRGRSGWVSISTAKQAVEALIAIGLLADLILLIIRSLG